MPCPARWCALCSRGMLPAGGALSLEFLHWIGGIQPIDLSFLPTQGSKLDPRSPIGLRLRGQFAQFSFTKLYSYDFIQDTKTNINFGLMSGNTEDTG